MDFIKVVDELERIGYNGFVNAEMTPAYKRYPDQILINTYQSIKRILDGK